jgi:mRNA turnover protein 4
LTQTDKKRSRQDKGAYIEQVRKAVDKYETLYLFSYENMRSTKFKNVRMAFRGDDSRIFLGKNSLLQIALGKTPEDEYQDNLRHVAKRIEGGSVGLLFTSQPREQVEAYFQTTSEPDYARAGAKAPRTVEVPRDQVERFPVSMMEQFRKLGMPVEIKNGKVILRDGQDTYRICKEGETLTAEKCKLLTHFEEKLSKFAVHLACRWSNGEYEVFDEKMEDE